MINLRSIDLQMIIIYHVISLLIFALGLYLIYSEKQYFTDLSKV